MVERKGEVRAKHMSDVTAETLTDEVTEHVHEPARVLTDKHSG